MPDSSTAHADSTHGGKTRFPAPRWKLFVFLAAGLLAGWVVLLWLDGRGRCEAVGYVGAESLLITADRDGRLVELIAEPGQPVDEGVPIALLEDVGRDRRIAEQRRLIDRLESKLTRAEAEADVEIAWRMRELQAEIHRTKQKAAGYLGRQFSLDVEALAWRDFEQSVSKPSRLAASGELFTMPIGLGLVSEAHRLDAALEEASARNASEVLAARIELCDGRLSELKTLEAELPEKVRQAAGIEQLQTDLKQAQAELQRLQSDDGRFILTAPGWGRLGTFRKRAGETVEAGQTIVELYDPQQRYLIVQLPPEKLPYFHHDAEVGLRFSGNKERSGRVSRVVPAPLEMNRRTSAAGAVPVIIEPTGKLWPHVPLGTTVKLTARPGAGQGGKASH